MPAPEPVTQTGAAVDRDNPWPGLASFTEDARSFFFGRERETDELSRLVRRETLTVLFGQSGLGKSSLLQAGLFPLLRADDFLPLYLRLDHSVDVARASRPWSESSMAVPAMNEHGQDARATPDHGQDAHATLADQVKAALVAAFNTAGADAPAPRADETLWEYFHRKDIDIWSAKNRLLTPVLAFDQFEEIFTLGRASDAACERSRAFLDELACLVENRAPAAVQARLDSGELDPARFNFTKPSCQVILSLREDFLPDLEGLKQQMPALIHNRLRLKKLGGTQALEIVTRPASHLLAEGVAEKIVEFVAGARGGSAERLAELDIEPPLLSVICRELNERRRVLGQAQITADLVSGNRREILNDFYERSVADLPAPMRAFVEDRLLTKSGFRDNLALETALEEPGVTQPLIDLLVARRLVRIEDRMGVQRVELTHDVLAEVVRNSRDKRQQRLAFEALQERERAAAAAAKRQARRQRFAIAGLAAVVAVLGVGAIFGLRAQRHARQQAARADLETGSRLLDEGKIGDGLAYLVNAARADENSGVAPVRILSSLAAHTFTLPTGPALPLPSPAEEIRYLAGEHAALAQCADGKIRLIDLSGWRVMAEYTFEPRVARFGLRVAARNPDVFAVALTNDTIVVCDTATGKPRFAPIAPPARAGEYSQRPGKRAWLHGFELSPDGRWLRTNNESWTLFDAHTGEERSSGNKDQNFYVLDRRIALFLPDSARFITSGVTAFRAGPNQWQYAEPAMEIRSVPDGRVLATLPIDKIDRYGGQPLQLSRDGKRLLVLNVANASAGTVIVFDLEKREPIGPPIPIVTSQITQVWLTQDGTGVVLMSNDRSMRALDAATGRPTTAPMMHGGPARGEGWSDNGAIVATVSVDGYFRLWDLRTGQLAAEATQRQNRPAPLALAANGRSLLLSSDNGSVHRLQLTRGPLAPLELPRRPFSVGPPASPPSPTLVQHDGDHPGHILWMEGRRTRSFDIGAGRWMSRTVHHPTGAVLVNSATLALQRGPYGDTTQTGDTLVARATGRSPGFWTWTAQGPRAHPPLAEPVGAAAYMAVSPSGKHGASVLAAQVDDAWVLAVWEVATGKAVRKLSGFPILHGAYTQFSPDDRRIVLHEGRTTDSVRGAGSEQGFRVYEIESGRLLFKLPFDEKAEFRSVRFTPDGRHLLTGDAWGKVQVWDGFTGSLVHSTQAHSFVVDRFDFSADGKFYASQSMDGTAQVWDSATHHPISRPLHHSGALSGASFSHDNARLATTASDGSGRIWDIRSGLALNHTHGTGETAGAGFSADDRFIMTHVGRGMTITATRLWPAPPPSASGRAPKWLLELATLCAGRRLDADGKIVSATDQFDRLAELRREIAALPATDPYAEWARWFLSESPTRSIAPGFAVTPAEAKARQQELEAPDPLIAWTAEDNAHLRAHGVGSEPLERQMLAHIVEVDGEGSSRHADHLIKLAQTLVFVGKFAEAEQLARACLAIREKAQSGSIPSARATLGSALVGLQRYAEAEPLLVEAVESFRQLDAQAVQADLAQIQTRHRVAKLVELYLATGRPEKAAEWRNWQPRTAATNAAPADAAVPAPGTPAPAP